MSLAVRLTNGATKEPDQVCWTDAGWLQATWHYENPTKRVRRFYPPHRIQFVRKTEIADGEP